ncbi:hypothetical protein LCGC14_1808930 [marine sediment metagenome]|uniref:Disease resistance R13L4/SHOC-2-like LRR domain-containing protein n=1 Tax=marine sediment metagenome TaxID=412755 RepID=A0A0F9HAF1_9ZZZZ|nr:leucine-rich repeat domain-containing protein [bacterium]
MDEFTVNKYISLKLEKAKIGPRYKTNIYVKGEKFLQCKFLLLEIPTNHTESFDHIDSIDEAAELLDNSEEFGTDFPPETGFWGHCSNLQVWAENNYDTRLLRSNLAFPLLKKLVDAGDPLARKVFKEEIMRRLNSGHLNVARYLFAEGFVNYLSPDDLWMSLLEPEEAAIIVELEIIVESRFEVGDLLELKSRSAEGGISAITIKNRRVISLYMSGQLLRELPLIITKLKALKHLCINDNYFETLPVWLGSLEHLESLNISSCELESLPTLIGQLSSLRKLNLFNNYLIKIPESIGNLTNLIVLNCDLCRLRSLPESIGNLISLKSLDLASNPINKLPSSIKNLINLEIIDISSNRFINFPEILLSLPKIKKIRIHESMLETLNEEQLKELEKKKIYVGLKP